MKVSFVVLFLSLFLLPSTHYPNANACCNLSFMMESFNLELIKVNKIDFVMDSPKMEIYNDKIILTFIDEQHQIVEWIYTSKFLGDENGLYSYSGSIEDENNFLRNNIFISFTNTNPSDLKVNIRFGTSWCGTFDTEIDLVKINQ